MAAGAGLAGSLAAIALLDSGTAEIAAVLALGALAVLAGHAWGLMVVVVADVVLLGHVWPLAGHAWSARSEDAAVCLAVVGALPGLWLLPKTIPGIVEVVMGRRPSRSLHGTAVTFGSVLTVLWLIRPVLL